MTWTIRQAAREFGVAEATIRKGLTNAGVEVKAGRHGNAFTTRQIVAAIFGDLKHERLLKTREERTLLELERREKEGELVSMAAAMEMMTQAFLPWRQKLLALSAEMAARVNPADPQHARGALDDWTDRAMKQIQSGISNGKPTTKKASKQ